MNGAGHLIRITVLIAVATAISEGTACAQWLQSADTPGTIYYNGGSVGIGTSTTSGKLTIFSKTVDHLRLASSNPSDWTLTNYNAGYLGFREGTATLPALTMFNGGRIGVSLNTPALATAKLTVFSSDITHFTLLSSNPSAWSLVNFNNGYFGIQEAGKTGFPALAIANGGRVGIGAGPGTSLADLGIYRMLLTVGSSTASGYLRLRGGTTPGTDGLTGIVIDRNGSTTGFVTGLSTAGALRIAPMEAMSEQGLTDANNAATGLTMDTVGNVTIGPTPSTGHVLTVNGNVKVTGNIGAKYQDIAEWVPSEVELAPATVVVLSGTRENHVEAATRAYDSKVAGVVSAMPGIILGEEALGHERVATTGRVKVNVDATRAPIAIGDLLVTSSRPGFAMKSEPIQLNGRTFHQPGTIIGKALQPLAGGTGEILVLLSLQ
jgi:hypothetical protein